MKRIILVTGCWLLVAGCFAQTVSQKLQKAYQQFDSDSQLKHAISSLYVIDAKTGDVVFDKNSQIGLADASTQKIITAATAFELLGKDYRYKTDVGYTGEISNGNLKGDIVIVGCGDPTFGSWRWDSTKGEQVIKRITESLKNTKIKEIDGTIYADIKKWESQAEPDGWIWQDMGNYYGSGVTALNWRENQFDLFLKSGEKVGDPVEIVGYDPPLNHNIYYSEVKSAVKGSGDNAYIYLLPKIVRGTIPVNEDKFKISGAMPFAYGEFLWTLADSILKNIVLKGMPGLINEFNYTHLNYDKTKLTIFHTETSPSLDSIIYWFLKKSINLYGESLIKTFAYEKKGFGATDSGVVIVKDFWKQKGVDENELNISDGSGLSPINRVTTHAQVEILKYAKTKEWFPYFYDAFPEFNGMKMKSGTISDVKAFCGYQTGKDGKEYIFSFIVNNYNGKTSELVSKMYKVLDNLK